jgi:hypothetical protein
VAGENRGKWKEDKDIFFGDYNLVTLAGEKKTGGLAG